MSIERLVRVRCDAQFESGVAETRRGECERDFGDVYETIAQARVALRACGWTVGMSPNKEQGYVRCPMCTAARQWLDVHANIHRLRRA